VAGGAPATAGSSARTDVAAGVGAYVGCKCSIEKKARTLLLASLAQVVPLCAFEKEDGFGEGDQRGLDFATARLTLV
jgi:hypothetical protein